MQCNAARSAARAQRKIGDADRRRHRNFGMNHWVKHSTIVLQEEHTFHTEQSHTGNLKYSDVTVILQEKKKAFEGGKS